MPFLTVAAAALTFCTRVPSGMPAGEVLTAFAEAYNRGDGAAVARLVDRKAAVKMGPLTLTGEQLANNYRDNLFVIEPLNRMTVIERMERDDVVVQIEMITRKGDPDETFLSVYRVQGGCIVDMIFSTPAP